MGRAMLIIVTGLLVAVGYMFNGMKTQKQTMTNRNVNIYHNSTAQNLAHTGLQMAIEAYNEDQSWTGGTFTEKNGTVILELTELMINSREHILIESTADASGIERKIIATYDVSEKEQLVPTFNTSLGILTDDFTFTLGGSATTNGYDKTGQCQDAPGILVKSQSGQSKVGTNSGIDGNPEDQAAVNTTIDYDPYSYLVEKLAHRPGVTHLSGNYKGSMGTETDPGIFFVDEYTKLSGGIEEGYGIMVIRKGGELGLESGLDLKGNFTFNGLVIFENAYSMDAAGTPTINGSVIVGSTQDNTIDINITGNVALQYDCTAQKYADMAVENNLPADRLYRQTNLYE